MKLAERIKRYFRWYRWAVKAPLTEEEKAVDQTYKF